jgi:uncharacterized protein
MAKKRSSPVLYGKPSFRASPKIPLALIRRFARQIAERFRPEKIILFGSYAYGNPHADSDVDLMVIMPANDVVNQAIRICLACKRSFPLDLIVRTPNQVERGLREGNWFFIEVIEKGKVLYEARNSAVGAQSRGGLAGRPGTCKRYTASPRSGVLPLPTGGGKVSQSVDTGKGRRRSKNT